MFIRSSSRFLIYFGDAGDGLMPAYYLNLSDVPLLNLPSFAALKGALGAEQALFLHQTHSNKGLVVNQDSLVRVRPFKEEGDYLVTNEKRVGVGVMTADCLPIFFYDKMHHAVAAIHAGWRGSVIGIAVKALECMREEYGTRPEDVRVFFGPSAGVCCYEVSPDFTVNLEGFSYADKERVLVARDNKLFFDLALFNWLQLEAAGVKAEAISAEYNLCTICNHQFYSYRRDGEVAGRQMSVICLV